MNIAIIGGKLQGVEAAYLAAKAGWEVTVIDRNPHVPASGLCHHFIRADISSQSDIYPLLGTFDWIIPALENQSALAQLQKYAQIDDLPILFDFEAYAISSSKIDSDRLFRDIHIPLPAPYPDCGFPLIAKPNHGSGSHGIHIIHNDGQLRSYLAASTHEYVLQKFVPGPSYSLEVLGAPGNYYPLQVTELEMDPDFDCKRIVAPSDLPQELVMVFERGAVTIAEALALDGLMDIEVIRDGDTLRVLEIDARLPSQTPISVYASTGVNMLQLLTDSYSAHMDTNRSKPSSEKGVIFEHIHITENRLTVRGEGVMASAGPLHLKTDFFGADEVITNQLAGRSDWVATLIIIAQNRDDVWQKRRAVIANIMDFFRLDSYHDPYP